MGKWKCIECSQIFDSKDKTQHELGYDGLVRRAYGSLYCTQSQWVKRSWKEVQDNAAAATTTAVSTADAEYNLITGISMDRVRNAANFNSGAGARLTPTSVFGCLEAIKNETGFAFDQSVFVVSFAHWYALTTGSMEEKAMGSVVLQPHPENNPTGDPKRIDWSVVFSAWQRYGTTIGINDLTPRKFFRSEGIITVMMDIYKTHKSFAEMRTTGCPASQAAQIEPATFWLALPGADMHCAAQLTEAQIKSVLVRHSNAVVTDQPTEKVSLKFDPNYAAHSRIRQRTVKDHANAVRRNVALSGLVQEMQKNSQSNV